MRSIKRTDKKLKGRSNYVVTIPRQTVKTVRAMRFAGRTMATIVKRTGVSASHVSRIANLKSRTS